MASNEREDMKTCKVCSSIDITNGNLKARNYLCRDCDSKKGRAWRGENKDHCQKRDSKKYFSDRDRKIQVKKDWAKNNPEKVLAKAAKRRATKLGQTPEMNKAELVEIESMYMYNEIMLGDWHVDHIQPLAAGGLHHPSNLQVLSKFDNLTKGAKWDM